jgi:hypothetical protein
MRFYNRPHTYYCGMLIGSVRRVLGHIHGVGLVWRLLGHAPRVA